MQLVQEEVTLGEMVTLLKLQRENIVVKEVVLKKDSEVAGKSLSELSLPYQSLVATVLREGRILIPRGDLKLQAGDKVLFIAAADKEEELQGLLGLD